MPSPRLLLLDPAPARATLPDRLAELGYRCSVAHGLHHGMVQAMMHDPALVVADLSLPDSCGLDCRAQLRRLDHFKRVAFITLGAEGDLPGDIDDHALIDHIRKRLPLPEPAEAPPHAEADPDPAPEPVPSPATSPPALAKVLAALRADRADTTLAIASTDGHHGEIMVRHGTPIHAVTESGRTGTDAMDAMGNWRLDRIEPGPPPRDETPTTLSEPVPAEPTAEPIPAAEGETSVDTRFSTEPPAEPSPATDHTGPNTATPAARPAESLQERLVKEVSRAYRHGRSVGLVLFQFDGAGPESACRTDALITALEQSLRLEDAVESLQNGLVAVMLPETGEAVRRVANRLTSTLATLRIRQREVAPCKAVGWAWFPHDGKTAPALLDAAMDRMDTPAPLS